MARIRSMKAKELRRILERKPLGYRAATSSAGSHVKLNAPDRPTLIWAFHDNQTLSPGLVRKILSRDVGLTDEEINDLL